MNTADFLQQAEQVIDHTLDVCFALRAPSRPQPLALRRLQSYRAALPAPLRPVVLLTVSLWALDGLNKPKSGRLSLKLRLLTIVQVMTTGSALKTHLPSRTWA